MSAQKMGVFICGCGGNISDYVDVEKVRKAVEDDPGVAVARTAMFTCSDATQQDIIDTIREQDLDGIVVASCSPKLHLGTFRAMAGRAGLNRYVYNQVNVREQCSWTHTHDNEGATEKAIRLVRAGIAKTRTGRPLDNIRIETTPRVLIVGAGVAGMRAALAVADFGLEVHLVEQAPRVGGQLTSWGPLFPRDRSGEELVQTLARRVEGADLVTLHTSSKVVEKSGSVGEFQITIENEDGQRTSVQVGAILAATGFERYTPDEGEFGFGLPGVVTLDRFRDLLQESAGKRLQHAGRPIRDVAYIYCVGSRQPEGNGNHTYCSRYCCSAAVHTSLQAGGLEESPRQFHLYRDMRTYGKNEMLYDRALREGSMFLKFADHEPPSVSQLNGRLQVTVKDLLTSGEEISIPADLVVLVTGMEARPNEELVDVLKLPVGRDGFFNEIHPKLRPVETVLDGILIAGASQGPKDVPESIASASSGIVFGLSPSRARI